MGSLSIGTYRHFQASTHSGQSNPRSRNVNDPLSTCCSCIYSAELRCTPISGFQFPTQTPPVSLATTFINTAPTGTSTAAALTPNGVVVDAPTTQLPLTAIVDHRRLPPAAMMRPWAGGGSPGRRPDHAAATATARQGLNNCD